ncbi:MAG: hypothetical protein JSR48_11985 [Verrucomicrobia bacterium]|nr:hypothetical protein [Verrucomicrobiota bacterium]
MGLSTGGGHQPPADSTMTVFTFTEPDAPHAIVIGPGHAPYYVFGDGHVEDAAPGADD